MSQIKKIRIADLLVNTENYRFEPLASQREAIDKMIDNQKDNLFNLAEHILQFGLNPNDKIQVIKSKTDSKKFVVLEGNRRAVSMKLLHNPDLIEGAIYARLKTKFKKLHDDNQSKLKSEIECVFYDNAKEANIWIGVKHGYGKSGISTDGWDPLQKQRYGEQTTGTTSNSLQIINLLKSSSSVPEDVKQNVEKINTTNLDRLIDDPQVRDFLGIQNNNGVLQSVIAEKEVVKGLTQIVRDNLDPKFTVKDIYKKEDRKKYLDKFPKKEIPDTTIKAKKPWELNSPTTTPSAPIPPKKVKPNPKDRDVLIPKSCVLKINSPKINAMYHELQKISVSKFPNAVGVSFRVFMELSMDAYIEGNKLTTANKDSKLIAKITEVSNHLETNKLADKHICKGIRVAVNNKNDLLGIDTWHSYVHNVKVQPTSANLVTTWDNAQAFIEKLWGNIK